VHRLLTELQRVYKLSMLAHNHAAMSDSEQKET
jgi:hypothetical protein